MTTGTLTDLKQRWAELRAGQPHLRIRNAAQQLGVTEAELVATRVGDGVTRLTPDFKGILCEVSSLGKVMALTRNDSVVHERKGTYLNASFDNPHVGLFVGADIDLRIFWGPWSSAFAVNEPGKDGDRLSLQFFAGDGEAIHKVYLIEGSDAAAYAALVEKFKAPDQYVPLEVKPSPAEPAERPDGTIDVAAFRQGWLDLKDTHDFHMLTRRHGLSRTQALRLAPEGNWAVPVDNKALRAIVQEAAARDVPIMVFVGNKGMIQIHTGPVKNLMDVPEWFNVIDPGFNLHVKEGDIAHSWVVRKPSVDGTITALECFDAKGTQIVQIFGKRKPGIPELEEWRAIVAAKEQELKRD